MAAESEKLDIEGGESIPLQENGVRLFIKLYLNCHIYTTVAQLKPAFEMLSNTNSYIWNLRN